MVHLKTKIGEYAIIFNSKNEFLMVQLFDPPVWQFPGGRLETEDKSIEGLKREVKEETNLEIFDIKPVFTKIFSEENKYGVFFISKVIEPYNLKLSHEHQAYKWFNKNDIDKIDFWQPFFIDILNNIFSIQQ